MDEPIANSSQLVLPMTIAPASASFCTTVASYGGTKPRSTFDAAVVGRPRVQMLSFTAIGTPASGPSVAPAVRARSIAAARVSAASAPTAVYAFSTGSCRAMASSASRVIDSALRSPRATASRALTRGPRRSIIR